jgi:hypoxanthine phosphoribosyltransferase
MSVAAQGAIKTLFSAEAIAARVDRLASDIAATRLEDPIVVAVLKGSFIFAADLIRALHRHGLNPERTLAFAKASLEARRAARVLTCVLVDKRVPRATPFMPDFVGFSCPPVFVVGYGMDLHNRYRELPFIGELTGG